LDLTAVWTFFFFSFYFTDFSTNKLYWIDNVYKQIRSSNLNGFELANTIETGTKKDADNARKTLKSSLIELVPLFAHQPFFKSNDMTIVDACLAVLLWRLKRLDIDLGKSGKAVTDYASRLFSRESFKESLTDCEKEYNA
jgi:glutathione S-transferase